MTRRLLVVDDEPDIVDAIGWALDHAWTIDAAFDGDSALALLTGSKEFCAALVDLNLPGPDGGEVVRRLRKERPGLPVVLASASPHVDQVAKAVGANGWLRKPFDVDHLELTLEQAVAER